MRLNPFRITNLQRQYLKGASRRQVFLSRIGFAVCRLTFRIKYLTSYVEDAGTWLIHEDARWTRGDS